MADEMVEPQPGSNPPRVYLDSTFYFDRLITHRPGHEVAKDVTAAWDAGEVEVATSALTLTEVLFVRLTNAAAREKIDRTREPDILDLFHQHGARRFILIELSRPIAESARNMVWDHNVKPKDAIHVASVLAARIPVMFTNDSDLVKLSGKVGGEPALRIEHATWTVQSHMTLDEPPSSSSV